jgi:ubiquinone/menaquinone biosynthesis C-methylase UbiE
MSSPYQLDNSAPQTADRFASLQTLFDPVTVRHLEAIDVQAGWRCLEVGAGSGSIARWLATRTGPTGHVLATDLDPHQITTDSANGRAAIEVRRHDITSDPLPASAFDLIHARLVLLHLPEREAVLARMVAALKPGGHLLIEDFDTTGHALCCYDPHDDALLTTVARAFSALLNAGGADTAYSRHLPRLLRQAGLSDVRADGHVAIGPGGSAIADLNRANIRQTRDQLIAAGLLTEQQIEQFHRRITDPQVTLVMPNMISATGRRP